ncbi:class I SAM-dependent methyltransferase [Aestuariirhabdus litorea]|uniref:Methyltransferase n=1 Tax=Aestuariirhabdus litorea TaxID=2528527 RepID=A0A3P3VR30_9GAMM|nr:50S ribosomal protein L11 methyltransferase [Aestuariirhabdus litorea]RRJ84428.1 methyltransferase [Aestuariirhabdus litorea]RWW97652.1 methyltransferase domain-containing protein [Endozoicomonadaceae bacterium GTF-13]
MTCELDRFLQQRIPGAAVCPQRLPGCGALQLYLIDPRSVQRHYSTEQMLAIMQQPAYWSLCWGSGLALARYLLNQPQRVAGKRVLDFGAGSGVVAVAAALAGARQVIACDIDPQALAATSANARLNGVEVELLDDFAGLEAPVDLLVAADVLYDRANLPLLEQFCRCADSVLVGDSRIRNFQVAPYRRIARMSCGTFPDLDEFEEFSQVSLYETQPEAGSP